MQLELPFDPPLPKSKNELILVKFKKSFGRMGDIECCFITTHAKLIDSMERRIALGDALGKHSDITVMMDKENTKIVSSDQNLIGMMNSLDLLPIGWDLVELELEQRAESGRL